MTLRCKPNDLAFIVNAMLPDNIGRIVRVVALVGTDSVYGPLWTTRSERPHPTLDSRGEVVMACDALSPDAWLRPIRDAGDDAQDETLALCPAPVWEAAWDEAMGVQR